MDLRFLEEGLYRRGEFSTSSNILGDVFVLRLVFLTEPPGFLSSESRPVDKSILYWQIRRIRARSVI
jgi:hypothetical protein